MTNGFHRLDLDQVEDDYVLGILCEKAGLADYALCSLRLEAQPARLRLFERGRNEAPRFSVEEVVQDIWKIRSASPLMFDAMVRKRAGNARLKNIMQAVRKRNSGKLADPEAALRKALELIMGHGVCEEDADVDD